MKVVVFKLNHLGDNVVFVPALQALRRRCPELKITLLTTPEAAALYGGPLGPHEVVVVPKRSFDRSHLRPWLLTLWMWRIRRMHPEACLVSFDQGTVAHAVAKFTGARIRIGAKLGHIRIRRSLTAEIPLPRDSSPVTWNWKMAEALAQSLCRDEAWPVLVPPPNLRHLRAAEPKPAGGRRRIVVHSGARGRLNQWPLASFASVARTLSTDFDVDWIEHGATTGPAPAGTHSVPVDSLNDFAARLSGADLFLGNNSGPMHLANALGCPGVAVTGPSAMGWNPYWHRERWTVLRHPNLYCAPCEVLNRELRGCANLENPMACLKYWMAEMVADACRSRLEAQPGRQT